MHMVMNQTEIIVLSPVAHTAMKTTLVFLKKSTVKVYLLAVSKATIARYKQIVKASYLWATSFMM